LSLANFPDADEQIMSKNGRPFPARPQEARRTKRYARTSTGLQKTATSHHELFDQMTELYPHWVANQSWLMFGFPGA
jgi:hypothetical protein